MFSKKRVTQAAMMGGAAAAGYLASRIKGVKGGLSAPRKPFAWKPEPRNSVLLKRANLVDVKGGKVLKERGIVLSDGRIKELVSTRDLNKVTADKVFDCKGLFIIPGLINAHSHVLLPGASRGGLGLILSVKRQAFRNLEECIVHGVTTVRDAGTLPFVFQNIAQSIDDLELLGPRLISSGTLITVKGGHPEFARPLPPKLAEKWGQLAIQVTDPDSARSAVRSAVEQGARFIKIFFDEKALFFGRKPMQAMDDESVKALVDEAHELGKKVAVHQTEINGFRRAVKLGVDDLEHIPLDASLSEEDVESFMAGDHHITPTASVVIGLAMAPQGHPARSDPVIEAIQHANDHMLKEICPAVAEEAIVRSNQGLVRLYYEDNPAEMLSSQFLFDNEFFLEAVTKAGPNLIKLYEAGATICCGNDGGVPLFFPGTLFIEMEFMEWLGLSRIDVLRAATINGAKLLGMEDELGTLEPGKLADLVVLSSDPLEDIRAVERIEAVFRDGVLLYRGMSFPKQA
jgi:imidazolonepropionase-like amidohydrolase